MLRTTPDGPCLVLALLTGAAFGLFPIVSLWRLQPNAILKEGGDRGSSSRGRTRIDPLEALRKERDKEIVHRHRVEVGAKRCQGFTETGKGSIVEELESR